MHKAEFNLNHDRIEKEIGVTPAEQYLGKLCERIFLSLWSYPRIYRNQGGGKEICDLLVVFGNHILIFSDKFCKFPYSRDLKLDWNRWFKRAIKKSANQVWGAERWIKEYPSRLFTNRQCTKPFPVDLPEIIHTKFHLIIVAHGISDRIKKWFGGGSGSLMIDSTITGFDNHKEPFYIGDLNPQQTFVHILDDDSLIILMDSLDTISDFVAYLEKKENLMRGQRKISATGEEELLAIYLKNLNGNKEHDFIFPFENSQKVNGVAVTEGHWEEFQKNPQRLAQIKKDRISYMWDELIETFNKYALGGKQYYVSSGGFKDSEKILRFMAREPRYKRRYLAKSLEEILKSTPNDQRMLRVIPSMMAGDPYYVFLLFPLPNTPSISYDKYRLDRQKFLEASCMIVKLKYPDAKDIVGIATESGLKNIGRSEDSCYFDASTWNKKMEEETKRLQKDLGILQNPEYKSFHIKEYPDIESE